MPSHLRRLLILCIGGGTVFLLNTYAFVVDICKPLFEGKKDSIVSETESDQKTNPNKMLFISCGGFLE